MNDKLYSNTEGMFGVTFSCDYFCERFSPHFMAPVCRGGGGGARLKCRCYKTLALWMFRTSELQQIADVWWQSETTLAVMRGEQKLACAVWLQ